MSSVFAYRQLHASGFDPKARTLFFYVVGSKDTESPVLILPEQTSKETAEKVLTALGHELTEWESIDVTDWMSKIQ